MRIERQEDGTYLATERINGKLRICEASHADEAWFGLIAMIDHDFQIRADALEAYFRDLRGAA